MIDISSLVACGSLVVAECVGNDFTLGIFCGFLEWLERLLLIIFRKGLISSPINGKIMKL